MSATSDISPTVVEQYETIRESGATNMLMESNVRQLAESRGFTELVRVIENGRYTEILSNYDELADEHL